MSLEVQLEERLGNLKAGSVTADILSGAATYTGREAGNNVLSGGSRWVTFTNSFSSTPTVTVSPIIEAVDWDVKYRVAAGSFNTGSFLAAGSHATGSFSWIATSAGQW